jgi:hypothetical protein
MSERTVTGWATQQLAGKLSGLKLADGVATDNLETGGFVSGEVSISERKGKSFPIYSLELELPFEGTLDGKAVKGTARLPDVSLEMLDDLEVVFSDESGANIDALDASDSGDVIRSAVREWASSVRKSVSDNVANVPLDPPAQARQPRAAALISDEEAMSAGGAANLDDAADIEELPHPDDQGEEEEEPFTEEEVSKMYEEAKVMLKEVRPPRRRRSAVPHRRPLAVGIALSAGTVGAFAAAQLARRWWCAPRRTRSAHRLRELRAWCGVLWCGVAWCGVLCCAVLCACVAWCAWCAWRAWRAWRGAWRGVRVACGVLWCACCGGRRWRTRRSSTSSSSIWTTS